MDNRIIIDIALFVSVLLILLLIAIIITNIADKCDSSGPLMDTRGPLILIIIIIIIIEGLSLLQSIPPLIIHRQIT